MLHNPLYAGVYTYGRRTSVDQIVDGAIRRVIRQEHDPTKWPVLKHAAHPEYISWTEYMRNQDTMRQNMACMGSPRRGAPREGAATYARRQARDLMAIRETPMRRGIRLLTGAVVAIQRFGSRLTLHVHLHAVVPDAVWLRAADGTLTVIDLPAPSDDDVATLVRKVCHKMTVVVVRWQEAGGEAEPPEHANELTSLVISEPLLIGRVSERARMRGTLRITHPRGMADLGIAAPRSDDELRDKRSGRLAAMCDGYSLECRPNVVPRDRPGLARLLHYGTRPAFSQKRLTHENGRVVYRLPKPF